MTKLTENSIETFAIELLKQLGYQYVYAPDIAPDTEDSGYAPSGMERRASYEEVLLTDCVRGAIERINPNVPKDAREEALKKISRVHSPELLANNEAFHTMLTEGVNVSYQKDGQDRGDLVWLVDFENPENNDFIVANQFSVKGSGSSEFGAQTKRPDVVLFINGIPLVVMELKNPSDENASIKSAYKQLQTYKAVIPNLFTYNGFFIISDGLEARAGSLTSGFTRFMSWKSADGKIEASNLVSQLETLIHGMLNKETVLDLLRHFVVFEKIKNEDAESAAITISKEKKIAAYHQYYAVNKAIESTLRATGYESRKNIAAESPERYGFAGVKAQPKGDKKGGVVWHTQGSGKSLTMVFYTSKIVLALDNPTVLVITDRNDLDDQLFSVFAASSQLLRQDPKQIIDRDDLKEKLKVASGGIIFSTIQKFQPKSGNVFEMLSERKNIVVIADEAHRTQYGFNAKLKDEKDAQGNVLGNKLVYGFAKYMRDALPNATYLGFTGTPIEHTDINTPAVFGNYVDVYDISKSVEDGATLSIYYESRLAKVNISAEGTQLINELDDVLDYDNLNDHQKEKAKHTQLESLVGSKNRIQNIAKDIISHFELRQSASKGKAMIVVMSRRIAVDLYEAIISYKQQWHSTDLDKGAIKIVMTSVSSDGEKMARHHTTKNQRKKLASRMKDIDDELQLVIVCDMWLTGFDVPCLHTMYIDKLMKGHNLMQAIARVNRVYFDKAGGLVVDYLGIASDLKQALSFYSDAGGKGDPLIAQQEAANIMLEKKEIVANLFFGFDYQAFFTADTAQKLALILEAEDHILGLENGKKRFIHETTALSKAFAIATPHEKALAINEELAFFQAVKARLVKFETSGEGYRDIDIETTIKQTIDQAIVSEKVIDVFDAAGIKKPDVSIFSEEFFSELRGMKHKNIALEIIKKLLNDEIKSLSKSNLVQGKRLLEMLETAIKKYQNKIITSVEVMEALINISKDVIKVGEDQKAMGLEDYEYAFYCAVAENESAKKLMQKDTLKKLAIIITERVKKAASIDWTIKESVRSKLRVVVKRTLKEFGYPPDMQKLATDIILKQAEGIAQELTSYS